MQSFSSPVFNSRFSIIFPSLYPLYLTLALGGGILVFDLVSKLITLKFGSDLLAGMSIVTAILFEEYLAGSLVVLMLSGGKNLDSMHL